MQPLLHHDDHDNHSKDGFNMATPVLHRSATPDSRSHTPVPSSSTLQCCCGRRDCALLKKNSCALETVEKDVQTAAQLGQALLARHEAYMADAERDRLLLTAKINRLEMDKQELEAENALKIEENRNLLDQLEMLNTTVTDSDVKIRCLEASLLSSQQAVRRLETAAQRAEDAERHLALLEEEQAQLHVDLRTSKEDARTHAQRFKEAQRGILDMQDQLERIESESREERERHEAVIGRMERQRDVEKQLDAAAGRLKGAAATKGFQNSKSSQPIVGHFVRDLLQDNASLQLGIAELREMLLNSNDEIQSLREQLEYHQPLPEATHSNTSTLKGELEAQEPMGNRLSQELHIHHHYHSSPKKEPRKQKKKRYSVTPNHFAPPAYSLPSSPSSSGQWRLTHSPTAPALLAHTPHETRPTMSMPPPQNWSSFSNPPSEFASSVPSSPRSTQRNSVFDQGFAESSLPSPTTSFDPSSPTWRPAHSKRASEISFQSLSALSQPDTAPENLYTQLTAADDTIHEEEEEEDEDGLQDERDLPLLTQRDPSLEDSLESSEYSHDPEEFTSPPRLHRAVSHESIMSLTGGLDIHTLKTRPSQMALRPLGLASAEAVVTGVTAQPTLSKGSAKRSHVALRDHFQNSARPNGSRAVSNPMKSSQSSEYSSSPGSIKGWKGWRPWGGGGAGAGSSSPAPTPALPSLAATLSEATARKAKSPPPEEDKTEAVRIRSPPRDMNRPTGINQAGSIPGFNAYWAMQRRKGAPAKTTAATIDTEALREGLGE